MYVGEESDCGIVPMNPSNNDGRAWVEEGEGRPRVKENPRPLHTYPTPCGALRVPGEGGCTACALADAVLIPDKSRMR